MKALARTLLGRATAIGGPLGIRRALPPVAYVVERANWSIRWDGLYYCDAINRRHPGTAAVTDRPWGIYDRVLHFGSQFHWQAWAPGLPRNNRTVITYFHGKREDGPEMARHVDFFLGNLGRLSKIVTAASLTERRLVQMGVPEAMIARVPLGIDCQQFRPPTEEERAAARQRLGIPEGAVCIGSFQKDGSGWGEGMEPKLIKGPDIFVETCARLAKDLPVFVLLTGPARGYVKAGLERHGIPYAHRFLEDFLDLPGYFHALDLYLVTSREEGGPKAILESMASGVRLVSTRVGMAEDVIKDGINGFLADATPDAIAEAARNALAADSREAGRQTALAMNWDIMAERLYTGVYFPLLQTKGGA